MEQSASTRHFYYRTRLFVITLIVVAIGAALAGMGVFALLPQSLGQGYGAVISTIQGIGNILVQKVAMIYIVIVIGIVIAMIILHLFYSHRIAGPAYRLSREAAKLSEGNLSGKIKFRQKDNLTDMADILNSVADLHRARVEAIKSHLALVDTQSEALEVLVKQGKNDAVVEKAAVEITENIKKINKVLSEIRA